MQEAGYHLGYTGPAPGAQEETLGLVIAATGAQEETLGLVIARSRTRERDSRPRYSPL